MKKILMCALGILQCVSLPSLSWGLGVITQPNIFVEMQNAAQQRMITTISSEKKTVVNTHPPKGRLLGGSLYYVGKGNNYTPPNPWANPHAKGTPDWQAWEDMQRRMRLEQKFKDKHEMKFSLVAAYRDFTCRSQYEEYSLPKHGPRDPDPDNDGSNAFVLSVGPPLIISKADFLDSPEGQVASEWHTRFSAAIEVIALQQSFIKMSQEEWMLMGAGLY